MGNEVTWKSFTYPDRLKIREAYAAIWPDLLSGVRCNPYGVWPHNWTLYMSPIERNVWADIRCYGLPFYPQVPIGPYFVDFADPCKKIVIEVDGRAYHQDKGKDAERDWALRNVGYEVIRVDGYTTFPDLGVLEVQWTENLLTDEEIEIEMSKLAQRGCSEVVIRNLRERYDELRPNDNANEPKEVGFVLASEFTEEARKLYNDQFRAEKGVK